MVLFGHAAQYEWAGALARGLWYAGQGYVLLFSAYVLLPALTYLLSAARVRRLFAGQPAGPALTDFVLLVPAHNEARLLPGLLASMAQQQYPAARFRTVVVADNCTDATAALARQAGATCLERRTTLPSSKAQALRYAAEQLGLLEEGRAAGAAVVCILDADCRLDATFLAQLNHHFARPGAAPVVQGSRRVANAFASDVTVLDAAAEALRQQVGAGTRQLLGLEAFIFGLGCCLRQDVFAELVVQPTTSLAEDKEWRAHLAARRVPVAYCPAAGLSYEAVADGPAFRQQRWRWLSGQLASARRHGLAMLGQGLRRGSWSQLDFACDLLQPPRSVLLVAALLFGAVALATGHYSLLGSWGWLALAAALLGYGALGLRLIGAAPRHFLALFYGAWLVAGVARTTVLILLGQRQKRWHATR